MGERQEEEGHKGQREEGTGEMAEREEEENPVLKWLVRLGWVLMLNLSLGKKCSRWNRSPGG